MSGGGQAIGLACVDALLEAGANVHIADYKDEVAAEGRAAMKATGYATDVIRMDVTKSFRSRHCRRAGGGGKGPHRHSRL
jgi:NAD(P)-dependent dehydrogenase (short-subunit alcohol dehydrogenase family)